MPRDRDTDHFTRLIEALHPWLGQIVIVGGWAHRLYRLHPLAQTLAYEPLGTLDADVALPANLLATEESIRERLLANQFREELMGEFRPPVAQYSVTADDSGFYAEFLTPLQGSPIKRGQMDATASIAGVSVQKLRYLEILLHAPWDVVIANENGYPTVKTRPIRVPSATAYVAQKVLIHAKRDSADKAKDLLYIHDTLEVFAGNLPALHQEWEINVKPMLHSKAVRIVVEAADALFQEVNDYIREAARIAVGRNLTPEALREVCRYGWEQVFV